MGPIELGELELCTDSTGIHGTSLARSLEIPAVCVSVWGDESAFRFLSQNRAGESGGMGKVNGD